MLVAGVSFGCGPLIGTSLAYRGAGASPNLPVGVIAIIVVLFLLRQELLGPQALSELQEYDYTTLRGRLVARLSTMDYGGQMLFLWGLGLPILALTWVGGTYAWDSPAVVAPLESSCPSLGSGTNMLCRQGP